jgi:hypothetical protein
MIEKNLMALTQWCQFHGINLNTAQNAYRRGAIPGARKIFGRIAVPEQSAWRPRAGAGRPKSGERVENRSMEPVRDVGELFCAVCTQFTVGPNPIRSIIGYVCRQCAELQPEYF